MEIKHKTRRCVPVVSSYNDGECLQLTKVSSLMTVLYLAFAEPVCPQFNQRPGSHGNDTEHLGVHDLPNTVTKRRMKRTNNSSKWINALFFSARDFEVFRRASQPHMLEYFCKKQALLTQVTVTNLFFFCCLFLNFVLQVYQHSYTAYYVLSKIPHG